MFSRPLRALRYARRESSEVSFARRSIEEGWRGSPPLRVRYVQDNNNVCRETFFFSNVCQKERMKARSRGMMGGRHAATTQGFY